MEIEFEKIENSWYAILPDYKGDFEDCQMVSGADTWLEMLSEGCPKVQLEISDEPIENSELIVRVHHIPKQPERGATYVAFSFRGQPLVHEMWLCQVTLHVFKTYPEKIYYKLIKILNKTLK